MRQRNRAVHVFFSATEANRMNRIRRILVCLGVQVGSKMQLNQIFRILDDVVLELMEENIPEKRL
jgi:hypothetical protein